MLWALVLTTNYFLRHACKEKKDKHQTFFPFDRFPSTSITITENLPFDSFPELFPIAVIRVRNSPHVMLQNLKRISYITMKFK